MAVAHKPSKRVVERREGFQRYKRDVQERGQAVLSVRDVPRHGDEPGRRQRHRRPGRHLEVHRRARCRTTRAGSGRCTRRRRTRDDELHPAAGLVLLLPLLPAPDLQMAGVGDPRHGRDPDHLPDPPALVAVPRRAARAPAQPTAGRHRRLHPHRAGDGHADLEGRGCERGAGVGERGGRPVVDREGATYHRRPSRARSCSRSCRASAAIRTLARARRTSALPT